MPEIQKDNATEESNKIEQCNQHWEDLLITQQQRREQSPSFGIVFWTVFKVLVSIFLISTVLEIIGIVIYLMYASVANPWFHY